MAGHRISGELPLEIIIEELELWYREAISGDFDYVAAMSRRCPNILSSVIEQNSDDASLFVEVLTDNGLLLKAKEIARKYNNNSVFPTIVLLDDVLVHGRSLNNFLDRLFSLICYYLKDFGNQRNAAEIQNDFYKKITIRIFAMNNAHVFLTPEYQWRIHYKYIWPEKKWRDFSKKISEYIWKKGTANTSYVISAKVKNDLLESSHRNWIQVQKDVTYRDMSQKFYIYRVSSTQSVFPTVRSYTREGRRYYTPYVFLPKVDSVSSKRLIDHVFERIGYDEREALKPLAAMIEECYKTPLLHAVYGQLFTLIFSQIGLSKFLSDFKIETKDVVYDTYHIARNFGFISEIQPALDALCKIIWDEEFLQFICEELEARSINVSQWMCVHRCRGKLDNSQTNMLCESMEKFVYEQAVKHEAAAKEIESLYISGADVKDKIRETTGELEVNEFYKNVLLRAGQADDSSEVTIVLFSLLTQMMDSGDVSLKMKATSFCDEKFEIYSAVRNTEMSLSILPRRMKPCFQDFSSIVQVYWRQEDFLEQVHYYFFDFLPEFTPIIREYADLAMYFAAIIKGNKPIVDSLLDWDGVV